MTNRDSILKSRDISLLTKVHRVKAMLFPVVIYGYESWTIMKAESESESCSVMSNSFQSHRLYNPWNSPGQDTGVSSHFLLQGIVPTQGSNPGLSCCRQILYQLIFQGSPKKTEHQRIDAFELWCWRRLLRVPWTARRSNQSIPKEINLEYSLEGLILKLKLQYFGHLM